MALRFAVGTYDGSRSAVWRAWRHGNASKSDIFLASRSLAGTLKISFHESGEIRDAFTSQYYGQLVTRGQGAPGRVRVAWRRASYEATGSARIYQVCFPHSELRSWPLEGGLSAGDVTWIPATPDYETTCVEFLVTKPGLDTIEMKNLKPATKGPIAHWYLPSGENFLVVPRYANLEPALATNIRVAVAKITMGIGPPVAPEPSLRMNLVVNPSDGLGATIETAWPCTV